MMVREVGFYQLLAPMEKQPVLIWETLDQFGAVPPKRSLTLAIRLFHDILPDASYPYCIYSTLF